MVNTMRARNIKPGLFKNEILGQAEPLLTILFTGLWCLADKAGRLEDRPLRIKGEVFPYRDGLEINRYLTELERLGFIQRYSANGTPIIQVVNFQKHQNPHHTEKGSQLPENPNGCDVTVGSPLNNSYTPADSLIPDSLIPDSSPRVKKPKKKVITSYLVGEESSTAFEVIWKNWPKRIDGKPSRGERGKAEGCFQAIVDSGAATPGELVKCAEIYCAHPNVKDGYVKMISTFLSLEAGTWVECLNIHRSRRDDASSN